MRCRLNRSPPLSRYSLAKVCRKVCGLVRTPSSPGRGPRRLSRPRAPQRLVETLTPAELERLLAAARSRERLLIGILLDTGLRLGEVADLRVDDVLADGYLRVRGKGDKERLVPLGSVSQARLADYLRRGRPRPVGAWSTTSSSPATAGR